MQIGDPVSRDYSRRVVVGTPGQRHADRRAGNHEEAANILGAVAMALSGHRPDAADSQFFILRRAAPEIDGKYTVFGKVLKGMDVVAKIQRGDVLKRAYLKDVVGRIFTSPFRSG